MLGRARSPRGSCSIVVNPWALDQGGADDRGFGREGSGLAKGIGGQMDRRQQGGVSTLVNPATGGAVAWMFHGVGSRSGSSRAASAARVLR